MRLTGVEVRDFRNLAEVEVVPHRRFNVLVGENGQGKTSFLEALYWLATLRPLRVARPREMIRHGADALRVAGEVLAAASSTAWTCAWPAPREARREEAVRAGAYFGSLAVILFTPDDVGLVRGGRRPPAVPRPGGLHTPGRPPGRRRRPAACRPVTPSCGTADDAMVAAYEDVLGAHGGRMLASRQAYVAALAPRFAHAFTAIMGEGPTAQVELRADVEAPRPSAPPWKAERDRDRQRGFTLRGPHADDLEAHPRRPPGARRPARASSARWSSPSRSPRSSSWKPSTRSPRCCCSMTSPASSIHAEMLDFSTFWPASAARSSSPPPTSASSRSRRSGGSSR
ncbi:MAG: AAA family ATPase [bacterium]